MQQFTVRPVGTVRIDGQQALIQLESAMIPALWELNGFSHVQILWWFHECGDARSRSVMQVSKPYRHGPEALGTFATRSPQRPNPIALTNARLLRVDEEKGRIYIDHADAQDGSPVLDLKPYTPSLDRVERPQVPAWQRHWPKSLEESGDFDWEHEFMDLS